MRIRTIALKNLNSLYGEFRVDLDRDLRGAPLFLIRGPTGAGKSTITDAVALALFGQTPRLDRRDDDADPRQVLSRGTGDGYAEVEFTKRAVDGSLERYKATWQCRRARNKPEGELQAPRRILARLRRDGTWQELASDTIIKNFQPQFTEVLDHMTVEDFRRMMVLAQGEFAAFLQANESERARILERLTSTSRFRLIGRRAFERRQQAERDHDEASALAEGVVVLGEAEEAALRGERQQAAERRQQAGQAVARVRAWAAWHGGRVVAQDAVQKALEAERIALEARAAHHRDLDRLIEHERCRPAAEALRELERARGDQDRESQRLPGLAQDETDWLGRQRAAEAERDRAATRKEAAAWELEARDPEIRQARETRQSLAAARGELDRAVQTAAEAASALQAAVEAEAQAAQDERTARDAREQAADRVRSRQGAEALGTVLPALQSRWAVVQNDRLELDRRARALPEGEQRVQALDEEIARLLEARDAAQPEAYTTAETLARAEAGLVASLDGAPDAATLRRRLLAELDTVAERVQSITNARRLAAEVAATDTQVAARVREQDEAEQALAAGQAALDPAREAVGAALAALAAREADLDASRLVAQLARERAALVDGAACPLCGSADHPYRSDPKWADLDRITAARVAELEAAVAEGRKAVDDTRQQVGALEQRLATLAAWRDACVRARAERQDERAGRAALLVEVLGSLGAADVETLDDAEAAATTERERLTALHRLLDSAEVLAARARAAHGKAQERLAQAESTLALRTTERDTRRAALVAAQAEQQELAARIRQREADLLAELAARGVDAATVGEAMTTAAVWVQAFVDAQAAQDKAEQQLRDAAGRCEAARQVRETRQQAADSARAQEAGRRHEAEAWEKRAAEALGGEDPAAVEGALRNTLKEAEAALAQAGTSVATCQAAAARAAALRVECEARIVECVLAVEERTAGFERSLRELRLGSEADLLHRRLDEATAGTLTALRDGLDRDLQGARASRAAAEAHAAALEAARPADLDAALTPEAIAARLADLEAAHQETVAAVSTLDERLRAQDEARLRLGERLKDLKAAQDRFDLWKRLSALIGANQGDAFQRFAQTLNLAELIDKANHHLRSLEPRYSLVPALGPNGEPRLAFSIRDEYQGGEVRSLKTLSGGETFLVSLSLALALADYRTLRMPIETLLLDEGFGTLDGDTLQVARAALEALHSRGTQVGIISHVEALKENIPDCIVVEKLANGRSRIRVETGYSGPTVAPETRVGAASPVGAAAGAVP